MRKAIFAFIVTIAAAPTAHAGLCMLVTPAFAKYETAVNKVLNIVTSEANNVSDRDFDQAFLLIGAGDNIYLRARTTVLLIAGMLEVAKAAKTGKEQEKQAYFVGVRQVRKIAASDLPAAQSNMNMAIKHRREIKNSGLAYTAGELLDTLGPMLRIIEDCADGAEKSSS